MNRRAFCLAAVCALAATPAFAQAEETPEGVVRAAYDIQMRVYRGTGTDIMGTPALMRRFFTPALIQGIQRAEARARRPGGTLDDTLDFDVFSESQDPEVRRVTVTRRSLDGDRAVVAVRLGPPGDNRLAFHMARVDGRWLIADIKKETPRLERWSMRQLIRMPPLP